MSVKTTGNKLALVVGMLTLATSCTTTSDSSVQTQQSPNTRQVTDSATTKVIKHFLDLYLSISIFGLAKTEVKFISL